jgi:hypothetical protein
MSAALRASDAERDRVAAILRAAAAQGMLTLEEVDERLAVVYAAKFREELEPVTADLPAGGRPLLATTPEARAAERAALVRHVAVVVVIAALLVVAWAASDAPFFWPVWPLAFLVFTLVRRVRGPRWRRWP